MDSFLHKLMCLSIIGSGTLFVTNQFKDKDFLWPNEGDKIGHLIATSEINDGIIYFIDADGNHKTAEYIASTKIGGRMEAQMAAQLFNNEQRVITHMKLSDWRDFSTQFQRVKERSN